MTITNLAASVCLLGIVVEYCRDWLDVKDGEIGRVEEAPDGDCDKLLEADCDSLEALFEDNCDDGWPFALEIDSG